MPLFVHVLAVTGCCDVYGLPLGGCRLLCNACMLCDRLTVQDSNLLWKCFLLVAHAISDTLTITS